MGVLQPARQQRGARTAWLSPLIANVIPHFEHYCPLSQVHAKSHCANLGWRTPFLRKYLLSPFPGHKKISRAMNDTKGNGTCTRPFVSFRKQQKRQYAAHSFRLLSPYERDRRHRTSRSGLSLSQSDRRRRLPHPYQSSAHPARRHTARCGPHKRGR